MSNNRLGAVARWARFGRVIAEPPDHNEARWLAVRYIDRKWWVLRTCPCHRGEPVAAPYETEADALRCVHKLVLLTIG